MPADGAAVPAGARPRTAFPTFVRLGGVLRRRWRRVVVVGSVLALLGVVVVNVDTLVTRATLLVTTPGLTAAHDAVVDAAFPPAVVEDDAIGSCVPLALAVRCGWSEAPAREAVTELAAALTASGRAVGPVTCRDEPTEDDASDLGDGVWGCSAVVTGSRDDLHLVAWDTAVGTDVPLGRTAVAAVWLGDDPVVWLALDSRLRELVTEPQPSSDVERLYATVPARYDGLPCRYDQPEAACSAHTGPIDVDDLGGEVVPGLVAELAAQGYSVSGSTSGAGQQGFRAMRSLSLAGSGSVMILLDVEADEVTATVARH